MQREEAKRGFYGGADERLSKIKIQNKPIPIELKDKKNKDVRKK